MMFSHICSVHFLFKNSSVFGGRVAVGLFPRLWRGDRCVFLVPFITKRTRAERIKRG